uniref:Uncharacterized protein n=1 Tax=Arundo donax TaxID=35708 RepID=A0A0A8Y3Z6_ARUDO
MTLGVDLAAAVLLLSRARPPRGRTLRPSTLRRGPLSSVAASAVASARACSRLLPPCLAVPNTPRTRADLRLRPPRRFAGLGLGFAASRVDGGSRD